MKNVKHSISEMKKKIFDWKFQVTHELIELTALQIAVENENLPYCDRSLVVESLLECHTDLIFLSASGGKNEWSSPSKLEFACLLIRIFVNFVST